MLKFKNFGILIKRNLKIIQVAFLKSINNALEKCPQRNQFLRQVVLYLPAVSLQSTFEEIQILESCSVPMNKIFEIHLWKNFFFSLPQKVDLFLVIFVIVLNATLKMFEISFSKPPSRNYMFIQLMHIEDKIISFLYIKKQIAEVKTNIYF